MIYTKETVQFLKELPEHTEDHPWPEEYKTRYNKYLRDPTKMFANKIKSRFIQPLGPKVEYGICHPTKQGGYGYKDHKVFAFFDPRVGSWNKSVQLFFYLDSGKDSGKQRWYYGLSVWNNQKHIENFNAAILANTAAIAAYFRGTTKPDETKVQISGDNSGLAPTVFANLLEASIGVADGLLDTFAGITVKREYHPLESLLDHAEGLVDEVGEFFTWLWPLFQASRTGRWNGQMTNTQNPPEDDVSKSKTPGNLRALSETTSLSLEFLEEFQEALLERQQVVLVGPPGTSKTYIAQKFADYFVTKSPDDPEGECHTLYMHASWGYEDFFGGIRPETTTDGALRFSQKEGFFSEWVSSVRL